MASLPPRSSQRPSSAHRVPSADGEEAASQRAGSQDDTAQSTATLDSETLLVNEPTNPEASSPKPQEQGNTETEPRRCWICFSDETEDTPASSAWKSPCPCALVAHEACLLDWVADLESPQNKSRQPKKLECPQCKTDIKVARPRDVIVSSVTLIDRIVSRLTLPGLAAALSSSLWSGLWVHGMISVYIVFGRADFKRLTAAAPNGKLGHKWLLGAPAIPIALLASRGDLADGILPILPVLFFTSRISYTPYRPGSLWPPSAAMTFAALPYARAFYNQAYKTLFAKKERQWMRDLQPQRDGAQDDNDAQAHGDQHLHQGVRDFGGIQLDLEIIHEDFGNGDVPQQQQEQRRADEVRRLWDQAIVQDGQADHARPQAGQGINPDRPQAAANNNHGNNDGRNLMGYVSRAVDNAMGALCFPLVAATAGELLRAVLPSRLTTTYGLPRTGLLQTQWGRSVVGGCLFVVLKDALILYSRYKIAKGQKERRVVDWAQRPHSERRSTRT